VRKHDNIQQTAGGYVVWWRGAPIGPFENYHAARTALWDGPIGAELLQRQSELIRDRLVARAARQIDQAENTGF
jgi:hypothetical protein